MVGKRISVIVPVFNDALHLNHSIASICSQTIAAKLEIIIVDDGSTDDSLRIAQDSLTYHGMIANSRIISVGDNKGVANSRKVGIEAASGDFIMFCDSDDWMDSRMCELMLAKADTFGCDMVICDYNSVIDGNFIPIRNCYTDDFLRQLILCNVTGSLWNKLFKASILKNEEFVYPVNDFSEDHVYCIQSTIMATSIEYVPEPLYNYRKRNDSLVRSMQPGMVQKRYKDDMANLALELNIIERFGLFDEYRREITVRKLKTKNSYREHRDLWLSAYPELWKEIFLSPYVSWRSRAAYILRLFGLFRKIDRHA